MKTISLLTLIIILLSGCCVFTSQDCGCNPPEPDLSSAARSWIIPYDEMEFLTFEDDNGNKDSLKIERMVDTEFIGGDECGTDSEVERAILRSVGNTDLRLTIESTMIKYVVFNYLENWENFIYVNVNAINNDLTIFNDNSTGAFINNFDWNGEQISVLEINCENSSNCNDYQMKKFIISEELGLLEYIDNNNVNWKRIN